MPSPLKGTARNPAALQARSVGSKRVLLCTGKIGHELKWEHDKHKDTATTIVFLEQLYPFPEKELEAELAATCRRGDIV